MPSVALGSTDFAVVDVETTGFSPRLHDRVVEVAVVRLSPQGNPTEEYATLVNPCRDVGPTHVHGITATDVRDAPRFDDIAGDVALLLEGAVLVAHNLRFDRSFLEAEFARTPTALPPLPGLCTLELAYRLERDAASRKLPECCARHGIALDHSHSALADARAVAKLLGAYLEIACRKGTADLEALGCAPLEIPPPGWCAQRPSRRSWCRGAATEAVRAERCYLARLVDRLPGTGAPEANTAGYLELVDRALEDRRITREEADALAESARDYGLSRAAILDAHRLYLGDLVRVALADSVLSPAERRDLEAVSEMLGLDRAVLERLVAQSTPDVAPSVLASPAPDLAGVSVCFTGTLSAKLHGRPITREQAEEMARTAGLRVMKGVTRDLDILVVADPNTLSSKAQKARASGVRILAEAAFWRAIRAQVE